MSLRPSLTCPHCGKRYNEAPRHTCEKCGSILEYRLERGTGPINFTGPLTFWRYRPVLPKTIKTVSLGEGGTPLQKAQRLAETLQIENLYLKDETRNPTSSFKDRSAALIISDAVSRGYDRLICATNGNHGASVSAYSARVDIQCNLIVPKAVDLGKLAQMMMYDAKIVEAGDSIEEAIARAQRLEKEMGWYQATTELNPLSVEGIKTISYELVEQKGVPEWVILAMGSGVTLRSLWKGFKEMEELGLTHEMPRMIGVQAQGCSPITAAYNKGLEKPEQCRGDTIASAIKVADPIYGKLALNAIRDSDGLAVSVSDENMIAAGKDMAKYEGIFAELASCAPIACLNLDEVRSQIGHSEKVVCLVTSSGLKTDDILSSLLTKHKKAPRIGSRLATKERILTIIAHKPTYGYAIWKSLGSEMTLGAVYQHLTDLESRGLISSSSEGKRKFLEITERGRRVLMALDELQVLL
jgi:threonine synthase